MCTLHHATYREVTEQGLIEQPLVLCLDVPEVDLRAGDHNPHEGLVLSARALHGGAQPLREPRARILDALHWKRNSS